MSEYLETELGRLELRNVQEGGAMSFSEWNTDSSGAFYLYRITRIVILLVVYYFFTGHHSSYYPSFAFVLTQEFVE
jgi:hypothetical protein